MSVAFFQRQIPGSRSFLGSGTEIIPIKYYHTRIKALALALASGHGRRLLHNHYTQADTFSVREWPLHISEFNTRSGVYNGHFRWPKPTVLLWGENL